MKVNSIKSSSS